MSDMGWLCIHCGTQIFGQDVDVCPNCEKDPFHAEPNEEFIFNPRERGKFSRKGSLSAKKGVNFWDEQR